MSKINMTLGIVVNPYATNFSNKLLSETKKLSIKTRTIDLPSLTVEFDKEKALVRDKQGIIKIDCLAPYLLFGFPAAVNALRVLTQTAFCQNPVDSVLIADNKATTAEKLQEKNIPQVQTIICSDDFEIVKNIAHKIRFPVVLKRAHGAQGRWVRLVKEEKALKTAFDELIVEGRPTILIVQPFIRETKGKAIRVIVTGEKILAATERIAKKGEWRSNIAYGSLQYSIDLTQKEKKMVLSAIETLGLGHAGIDLLRTSKGPVILEINSCPDFITILSCFKQNLIEAIVKASMKKS